MQGSTKLYEMMTAESMLWKRQVTMKKITLALFFLFKLFSSHIHSVQNALFVLPIFYQAPQKACEAFRGLHKFLDMGRIWPRAAVCAPLV